ncbi:hypothetical protein ACIQUM_29350 [Amycolatopsis azurea]|uniref:hypothetical protein n=1 Tax=Amycolatopsis azurea TaxID=36819 RepID=UPI0038302C0C
MTDLILRAAQRRASVIRKRLGRNKLVFVQCGTIFDVLREPLVTALGGTALDAVTLATGPTPVEPLESPVVITGIEAFAATGKVGKATLGALRERVDELLQNANICLISRSPRIAYAPVPGSNLLEDASPFCIPLLDDQERPEKTSHHPSSAHPSISLAENSEIDEIVRNALEELGVNVLTELDFALFEARHDRNFVNELDPSVAEAIRTAGFAQIIDEHLTFTSPVPLWKFQDATANAIANLVKPQADLGEVSDGLWQIERTIRKAVRDAAIEAHGTKWRKNIVNEAIGGKALERARDDSYVTAQNISELRDPTEWLSLGELLETVQSTRFNGLSWDAVSWQRFKQDIVPIRNRLSHMRLLKKGDKATVKMWVNRFKSKKLQ